MQATDSAVRREITVNATPERAFFVFAEQFDSWWPRSHKIGQADLARAVIDPDTMRWYEVGTDGSTTEWGAILTYDPPTRLTLEWRIGGTWQCETDPARSSEIDVTFTPEGDATRVTLEHRHLDRHTAADELKGAVGGEGGWNGLLRAYSEAVG
ncbi:SRPBCC family protein [Solirubrobacter soli]|uniref:SRPBCC family protein n=1 Tax=Solirubrobacter soli TaxID=363832 RepID=UPI000415C618|nr:SRPBCC family protein [Solirubrobacter soli]